MRIESCELNTPVLAGSSAVFEEQKYEIAAAGAMALAAWLFHEAARLGCGTYTTQSLR
jgi:hypothetical protein